MLQDGESYDKIFSDVERVIMPGVSNHLFKLFLSDIEPFSYHIIHVCKGYEDKIHQNDRRKCRESCRKKIAQSVKMLPSRDKSRLIRN